MKRLAVLIALVMLAVPCVATQITFDHYTDVEDHMLCFSESPYTSTCGQILNGAGGNSYAVVTARPNNYKTAAVVLNSGSAQTYAAATIVATGGAADHAQLFGVIPNYSSIMYDSDLGAPTSPIRVEVVVSGGTAYVYKNGTLYSNSTPLATTPYYIGFGGEASLSTSAIPHYWDDYVFGADEDTHVLSIPVDYYELQNDIIGAAGEGLVYSGNQTVISTSSMSTRFSRSALYDNENETVVFRNVETGTAYLTQYIPVDSFTGSLTWNLTQFFDSGAPYGFYEVAIPASGSDSEDIYYGAVGASVAFDAASYTTSSTAGITYTVTDSGTPSYWTPGSYDYRVDVISATTGETYCTSDIATSTGSVTCPFESGDTVGTVWAILIAKDKITNEDLWMGYDYADLNTYVSFTGYVNSETGAPISGANVNITQGSITGSATTIADGNYSLTGYISGSSLSFNVTASGYNQYYVNLTPLSPQEINLNFTLVSLTRSAVGSTIGGVARDGVFSSGTITSGYGRPISGATVYIKNTTNSESYTRTTNVAGYYVCGETESCFLTTSRPYDLWGQRAGYANSANYTVVAG